MEVRKSGYQARNVPTSGLNFHGNRNGVLVVLDHEDDRQFSIGGSVHRLPEFTFAGGAIAERDVREFVAGKFHVFELTIITVMLFSSFRMTSEVSSRLSAANGLQNLRTSWRRLCDDVESLISPMRWHLTAA